MYLDNLSLPNMWDILPLHSYIPYLDPFFEFDNVNMLHHYILRMCLPTRISMEMYLLHDMKIVYIFYQKMHGWNGSAFYLF